jgi:hypothetical protein
LERDRGPPDIKDVGDEGWSKKQTNHPIYQMPTMDKKQLFAEGKKKMEEQHYSSGENITPKAHPAAAYSAAICIGVLPMAGTGRRHLKIRRWFCRQT